MADKFAFGVTPTLRYNRSKFDLSHGHKTTGNAGDLIPFMVQEIYPGDSFKVETGLVVRATSSFLKPVMDTCFVDMYYFFVPNRLVFKDWSAVFGDNKNGAWAPAEDTVVPQVSVDTINAVPVQSIADYFGIFVKRGTGTFPVSDLPFRAYALIWNEWFRDENLQPPVDIPLDSSTGSGNNARINNNAFSVTNYHGQVAKINRKHDYFSSCLPAPQKGNPVSVPLSSTAFLPVFPDHEVTARLSPLGKNTPLTWARTDGSNLVNSTLVMQDVGASSSLAQSLATPFSSSPTGYGVLPANLKVDTSSASGAFDINDMRLAFQTQKMLEKDARGGTRYTEYLQSHFSVNAPDQRLQRPEYLGGSRTPINVHQVEQTSSATDSSPLANVAGYGLSNGRCRFTKGFVEHGFVIGLMAVRQNHTYQQGVEKFWSRRKRLDFYDPIFANIGEQPVYTAEIFADSDNNVFPDDITPEPNIFGYLPAWEDLRFRPSRTSGYMRSGVTGTLDIWHFGDSYANAPVLNADWIKEKSAFIDRTLSISETNAPQFIFDIYSRISAARILPTYGTPGLIDHH